MKSQVETIDCIRIREKTRYQEKEKVATESRLVLYVDNELVTEFQYSTGLDEIMVYGYLLASGRISNEEEIGSIEIDSLECKVNLAKGKITTTNQTSHQTTVSFPKLLEIKELLLENQSNHRATRGFHGAILYDLSSDQWFACEDIGRHNAVDKVIGYGLKKGFTFTDSVLLLSGRLLSNIVSKGIFAGIPVIASMTVSSDEGIRKSRESNCTLIGCLSDEGCWLYHEGGIKVLLE